MTSRTLTIAVLLAALSAALLLPMGGLAGEESKLRIEVGGDWVFFQGINGTLSLEGAENLTVDIKGSVNLTLTPGDYLAQAGGVEVEFYVPPRLAPGYKTVLLRWGGRLHAVLVKTGGFVEAKGSRIISSAPITGLVLPREPEPGALPCLEGPKGPVGYTGRRNITLAYPVKELLLEPQPTGVKVHVNGGSGEAEAGGFHVAVESNTSIYSLEIGLCGGKPIVRVKAEGAAALLNVTVKEIGWYTGPITWLSLGAGGVEERRTEAVNGTVSLIVTDGGGLDLGTEEDGVAVYMGGPVFIPKPPAKKKTHPGKPPCKHIASPGPVKAGGLYFFEKKALVVGRGKARYVSGPARVEAGELVDDGTIPRVAAEKVGRLGGARRGGLLVAVEKGKGLYRFEARLPPGVVAYNVTTVDGRPVEWWFQEGGRVVFYDDPNTYYVIWYGVPAWWNSSWHYRVPVEIEAGNRNGTIVRVHVDFAYLLSLLNVSGTFDEGSVRVVDDAGRLVPYQYYNASTGDVWFMMDDDAGTGTRYYIYFDVEENGAKAPLNTFDPNLGFESGDKWWHFSSADTGGGEDKRVVDACTEGSTVTVSDSASGQTVDANNTAHSGCKWALIGYRTNEEDGANGVHEEVALWRLVSVPTSGGNLTFWFRIQGWDNKVQGQDYYDYMKILVNGSDVDYTAMYFSNRSGLTIDSGGVGRAYSYSYNTYRDLGWREASFSLDSYAGSVVNVTFLMRFYSDNYYKTWLGIDDVKIPVYNATLNASLVEAYGVDDVSLHAAGGPVAGGEALLTAKVDATANVTVAVYDACGRLLGNYTLYDDGTHGDPVAGDQNYSLLVTLPPGCPGNWTLLAEARDNTTSLLGPRYQGLAHIPGAPASLSESSFFNIGNGSAVVSLAVWGRVLEDLPALGGPTDDPGVQGATVALYNDTDGDGVLGPGDTLVAAVETGPGGYYRFLVNWTGQVIIAVNSTSVNTTRGLNPGYGVGDIWPEETYSPAWNGTAYVPAPSFGGHDPLVSDNWSAGSVDDYAVVNVSRYLAANTSLDFGFSFDVVVNAEPTGQGSLYQFLANAEAIAGPDRSWFVFAVPPNSGDAHGSWWSIRMEEEPPPLGNYTVLNGTVYWPNMTVRDENPGYMLNGSYSPTPQYIRVGVGPDGVPGSGDEPLLGGFPRPEVEINLWGNNLTVSEHAVGVEILGVAFYNGSGAGETLQPRAGLYVGPWASARLAWDYVGLRANGSCGGNPRYGVWLDPYVHAVVEHSYIGCNGYGVLTYAWANGMAGSVTVRLSEVFANGRTAESPDGDGLALWNGNATVEACYIHGNGPSAAGPGTDRGAGVEIWYSWAENISIVNSTIAGNAYHGLRIAGGAHWVTVSQSLIAGNGGPGVLLGNESAAAYNVTLDRDSFYNNSGLAVDICSTPWVNGDGVTPNDGKLNSSQPDWGVDYPVITKALLVGDYLYVEGYINSEAAGTGSSSFAGARVDVYLVNTTGFGDNLTGNAYSGNYYGEPLLYLGSLTADADGNFSGFISLAALPAPLRPVNGSLVTGLTLLPGNGTSEAGPDRGVEPYRPGLVSSRVELRGTGDGDRWNVTLTIANGDTRPALMASGALRVPQGATLTCSLPAGVSSYCTTAPGYNMCVFTVPILPPHAAAVVECNLTPVGAAWGEVRASQLLETGVDPARPSGLLPALLALFSAALAARGRRREAVLLALLSILAASYTARGQPQFPLLNFTETVYASWSGGYSVHAYGLLNVSNPTRDQVYDLAVRFSENPGLPSNPLTLPSLPPGSWHAWSYSPPAPATLPATVNASVETPSCGVGATYRVAVYVHVGERVEGLKVVVLLPPGWLAVSASPGRGSAAAGGQRVTWLLGDTPPGTWRLVVEASGAPRGASTISLDAVYRLPGAYACSLLAGASCRGPASVGLVKKAVAGGFEVTPLFNNTAASLVYVLDSVKIYRNSSLIASYTPNTTLPPGAGWSGPAAHDEAAGVPVYYVSASFHAVPAIDGHPAPLSSLTSCTTVYHVHRAVTVECAPRPPPSPGHGPKPAPPAPPPPSPPSQPGGGAPPSGPGRGPAVEVYKRGWIVDNYTLGFEIVVVNRGGPGVVEVADHLPGGFAAAAVGPPPQRMSGGVIVWRVNMSSGGVFKARVYISSGWPLRGSYRNTAVAAGKKAEAKVVAVSTLALASLAAAAAGAVAGGAGIILLPPLTRKKSGLAVDAGALVSLAKKGLLFPMAAEGGLVVPACSLSAALEDPSVARALGDLLEKGTLRVEPCPPGGEAMCLERLAAAGAVPATGDPGVFLFLMSIGYNVVYTGRGGEV